MIIIEIKPVAGEQLSQRHFPSIYTQKSHFHFDYYLRGLIN